MEGDKFELVGSNLMTIDSKAPRLDAPNAVTGVVYSTSKKMAVRGLSAKANSIQVNFADDGKYGTERTLPTADPTARAAAWTPRA